MEVSQLDWHNVRDNRVAGVDSPLQRRPNPRLRFIALFVPFSGNASSHYTALPQPLQRCPLGPDQTRYVPHKVQRISGLCWDLQVSQRCWYRVFLEFLASRAKQIGHTPDFFRFACFVGRCRNEALSSIASSSEFRRNRRDDCRFVKTVGRSPCSCRLCRLVMRLAILDCDCQSEELF